MHTGRSENLFRKEAIDSLAVKTDGRPIATMPASWWWIAALCIAFTASLASFLWAAEYARKETVRGWLVSEPGVVPISHSNFATVARIGRKAGDIVRRGDPVLLLSSSDKLGSGIDASQEILDQLREQVTSAGLREALSREQFLRDHHAIGEQIQGVDSEAAALEKQYRGLTGRVRRYTDRQRELRVALDRGAIPKLELLRHEDELAGMQQAVARLRQESKNLDRERLRLVAAQDRLGIALERDLATIDAERRELKQRMALQEKQRLLELQSPVNGQVATLEVVAGATVRPQQLLATIIPDQSHLLADVYVPSRAVGMIKRGQDVRLLYDAFPHQQFGAASGKVESVAGFVSLPADIPTGTGLHEAAYKVRISVDSGHVEHGQEHYALRPGMALAAELILETRSLADWLLAPLWERF